MASRLSYVLDTSVFTHLHRPEVGRALAGFDGAMLVTKLTLLEFGVSAASAADWRTRADIIGSLCEPVPTLDADFDRAYEVQQTLAANGLKGRKPPDLLIAAVAERLQATVVHYDNDYALISDVTGQPQRWIVPRGSLATPIQSP